MQSPFMGANQKSEKFIFYKSEGFITNPKDFYKLSFLSSSLSAIVTKTVVAPLERLKVLKQSQMYYGMKNYNGKMGSSFRYILTNEGWRGFYRGNVANLVRTIPAYALKFPLNEFYKNVYVNKDEPKKFLPLLASGFSAGFTQAGLTYPVDILRTRMSLDKQMTSNYTNIFRCSYNIVKNEGFKGLYKGLSVGLTSYPMYVGIQFSLYEYLRDDIQYGAGTIAGIVAQTLMFPGDVIKRQMQLNGIDNTETKINGVFGCIRNILRTRGFTGLYQGYGINLLKVMPEVTLQFAVYDFVMNRLR